MPVLRIVFAMLAFGLVQPALAAEFWDPAQCLETMIDHVEHLEEDVVDIGELKTLLDAAQRKGDAAGAAHFETVLESKRVDGIQSMLKRIDTVEYVYCDKSLFDPALIARVDAARPYAEAGETVVAAVEEPVDLVVAGVTSTFVPYEMIETGGCRGPFIDLAITITNRGGTFPRPVDLEKREREYPGSNMSYLTVNLEFDWNNGVVGGQQGITVDKTMLSGGTLPKGAAITLPLRVPVGNNQTAVTVKPMIMAGSFLQISGDNRLQTERVPYSFDIPIWDAYTQSVGVASGPERDNKNIITAALVATIVNLGNSPFPGEISGSFSVRQPRDGPRVVTASGKSLNGTGFIAAGGEVRARIKGDIFVESSIVLLCPDGSSGSLADGNIENNNRVLKGNE